MNADIRPATPFPAETRIGFFSGTNSLDPPSRAESAGPQPVDPAFNVEISINIGGIVGSSPALRHALDRIQRAAPTDANMLIQGESGTGKELVARAIHTHSARSGGPFVCVNCGAVPRDLFESEFFGHARGAFTGAHRDRCGKFELAQKGTLFLDEIGELPLELQCKLLRALQEKEIERVGDHCLRKVDVRIVAATNRSLEALVETNRFRQDLYYRLNVVPVTIPPLRERPEDIPQLAAHFIALVSRRLKRTTVRVSADAMPALQRHDWPGNVRELHNVIERAVILSRHDLLDFDIPNPNSNPPSTANRGRPEPVNATIPRVRTETEQRRHRRENILAALQRSRGKVYGPDGAAAMLEMKPTTLLSRMKSLGIEKPRRTQGP